MSTFHLFPLLPPEIRRDIYILATPPRVVHLDQELESFEDFKQRLPSIAIAEYHLPPDVDSSSMYEGLRRAAAILRRRGHTFSKQTKLEAYGFSSNKKAQFSWEFENTLPFDILMSVPTLAFALYRNATIFSQAAIPSLLHTCRESRYSLISYGYQLAFSSTAQGPLTWFNFTQDTLLLDESAAIDEFTYRILYPLHQLRPCDIARIRRLALTYTTHTTHLFLAQKLCQQLKELILVEWDFPWSDETLCQPIIDPISLHLVPTIPQIYYKGEELYMLPVDEIDNGLWAPLEDEVFGVEESRYPGILECVRCLKQDRIENRFINLFYNYKVRQSEKDERKDKARNIKKYNKRYSQEFYPGTMGPAHPV